MHRFLHSFGMSFYLIIKARLYSLCLEDSRAVLCMLIKPDNLPSQTSSYRPISLLSAIMILFKQVVEKRFRKHLEDNGFFTKYQSGYRKSKSTNDDLFCLSQTIKESLNWGGGGDMQ